VVNAAPIVTYVVEPPEDILSEDQSSEKIEPLVPGSSPHPLDLFVTTATHHPAQPALISGTIII
jgi:hypothetical protein